MKVGTALEVWGLTQWVASVVLSMAAGTACSSEDDDEGGGRATAEQGAICMVIEAELEATADAGAPPSPCAATWKDCTDGAEYRISCSNPPECSCSTDGHPAGSGVLDEGDLCVKRDVANRVCGWGLRSVPPDPDGGRTVYIGYEG